MTNNLYVILTWAICYAGREIRTYTHTLFPFFFIERPMKNQENILDRFGYPSYFLRYRMNKWFRAKMERVNKTMYIKYYILRG